MSSLSIFRKILFCSISILISISGFSQNNDKQEIDKIHSPRKATILSAVLPGLGQAYNKKYWKMPVVYVGIGAFSYLAFGNQAEFTRYKNAYIIRHDGGVDEFTLGDGTQIYNDQALINSMDKYRKQRDLCLIGALVFYALQIVDANVDANLFDFDISDDLSLKISPSDFNQVYMRTPVIGINCKIKF
jgi:hypothetical protein